MVEKKRELLIEKLKGLGDNPEELADCIIMSWGNEGIELANDMPAEELIANAGDKLYQKSLADKKKMMEIFDLELFGDAVKEYIRDVEKLHLLETAYARMNFERKMPEQGKAR